MSELMFCTQLFRGVQEDLGKNSQKAQWNMHPGNKGSLSRASLRFQLFPYMNLGVLQKQALFIKAYYVYSGAKDVIKQILISSRLLQSLFSFD